MAGTHGAPTILRFRSARWITPTGCRLKWSFSIATNPTGIGSRKTSLSSQPNQIGDLPNDPRRAGTTREQTFFKAGKMNDIADKAKKLGIPVWKHGGA